MNPFATRCLTLLLLALVVLCPVSAQTTTPGWRIHTPLPKPLAGHAAVMLSTGEVLITGGTDASGAATTTSLLYRPLTGEIVPTLNTLQDARAYHALVAVPFGGDTRVFAIGGYAGTRTDAKALSSIEVLERDASSGNWRWRRIGNLSVARGEPRAAWDGAGAIVVTGGREQSSGAMGSGTPSVAADRIDVSTLQTTVLGDMAVGRAGHLVARIEQQDGSIRMVTATGENSRPVTLHETLVGTTWDSRANPPIVFREYGYGFGDIAGVARVFGGFEESGTALATGEWFDTKSGWKPAPRMSTARARFDATLVAGPVDTATAYLAVGGQGDGGAIAATEMFEMPDAINTSGIWTPFPPLNQPGAERAIAMTSENLPLVLGGINGVAELASTELYQPLRARDIAFGQVEAGRLSDTLHVPITNEWLLPVTVRRFRLDGSAEFIVTNAPDSLMLKPGATHTVIVRFRPNDAGPRQGRLLFDVGAITDTVLLSGTGLQSSIKIVTTAVDFDSVDVGTTKQLCFDAVLNNGTDPALIDSITIEPPGPFHVVSPVGQVSVDPGQVLQVCVEFEPDARGADIGAITAHLADRTFPITASGIGVVRRIDAFAPSCDTISVRPGDSVATFVVLRNPGDRVVTITSVDFTASAPNLFWLADPSILPLTIVPGDEATVEVTFSPQREATEHATATFSFEGGGSTDAELCYIARSRAISPSVPEIDFGTVCAGDTVSFGVLLENSSVFDTVRLASVTTDDQTGAVSVESVPARMLLPRETVPVTVEFTPIDAGDFAGSVTASGSFGSYDIPVRAKVLPRLQFLPRDASGAEATTVVVPVDLAGVANGVSVGAIGLDLEFDRTLLVPRRLVSLADAVPLDESASQITAVEPGHVRLQPVWQAPLIADGPAFGIECELLRGDHAVARLVVSGAGGADFCVGASPAALEVALPCGGTSSLIRTAKVSLLRVAPNPVAASAHLTLVSPVRGEAVAEVCTSMGQRVRRVDLGRHETPETSTDIDLSGLSDGAYYIRVLVDGKIVLTQPVTLIRN